MYASGMEAERTSNYTEALFYYSMAIEMDSKYCDAYEKRGDLYRRLKNYGKAKQDYIWAVNLNPKSRSLWLNLAQMNYELAYYKEAITDFTKILDMTGEDADIFYARGNAYNKNNEFEKAGYDYNKALELRPDFSDAREKLNKLISENLYTEANYGKKEEKSDVIVQNEDVKKEESAQVIVTNEDTKIEETPEVTVTNEDAKKEVTPQVKNEKNVKENKVENINTEEKKEEPLKETAGEIKPDVQDLIFKGLTYYEAKDFGSALEQYNKAAEISPGFAEAYYHKGRAYTELNDYTSAVKEYSKTIKLNPNHEKAYINRGFIYNELKEFGNAINDFQKGVEINPASVIGFYNMGIAYHLLGNNDKTVECFQAAARLGDTDSQDWLKSKGYSW